VKVVALGQFDVTTHQAAVTCASGLSREAVMFPTAIHMPAPAAKRKWIAERLVATALVLFAFAGHAAELLPLVELAKPGRVLMLRHANAPGIGDPPNFRADDCSTQRNLDATGRAQAARLGEQLAKSGVVRAKVYSSQWCRCLETALLLKLGPATELPALNSFYGSTQDREPNLSALRAFLAGLPVDGPPVVLVTHQFTINAFTGRATVSGGGTIFELNGSGAPRVLGEIEAN
jgi:phosphohistidine phosphatase SixA